MSTRDDATLSAAERAALAGLESKAEADDPRLAAQLRGGHRNRPHLQVPPGLTRASQTWAGPVLVVAGLAAIIAALSVMVVVAAAGVLMLMAGGVMSTSLVRSGVSAVKSRRETRQAVDPGRGDDRRGGPRPII